MIIENRTYLWWIMEQNELLPPSFQITDPNSEDINAFAAKLRKTII
jgi:hypothetical protein